MAGFALEVWRGTASRRQLKAIYEAAWFKKSKRANCKGILHAAATIRGLISRVVVARERNLSAYLISRSVLDRRTQEYLSPVFRKHNGAAPASRRIMPANKDKGKIEERENKNKRRTSEKGTKRTIGVESVGEDQDKSFTRAFIPCRVFTRLQDPCINDILLATTKIFRGKTRDSGSTFLWKCHARMSEWTCVRRVTCVSLYSLWPTGLLAKLTRPKCPRGMI